MLELNNVSKTINNKKILNNINMKLSNTGLVILNGKSGSGKTTLLNIISSLDKDYNGTILFNNNNITINDISFVFQDYNLFDELTVLENINIYENQDDLEDIIFKLNLNEIKNKKVKLLSGGEKRIVCIARALLKNAKIILLDEPTSSLDNENILNILNILKEYSKNHLVIISTHENIKTDIVDTFIKMDNGKLDIIFLKENDQDIYDTNKKINIKFINKITNLFLLKNKFTTSLSLLFISILLFFILFSSFMCEFDFAKIQAQMNEEENINVLVYYSNKENEYSGKRYYDGNYYNLNIKTNNDVPFYYLYVPNCNYFIYDDIFVNGDIIGYKPNRENEIMIYQILAEMIMYYGISTSNGIYKPNNINELIGKTVKINDIDVIISGIILNDLSSFNNLKNDYDLELNIEKNKFASKYDYYKNIILVSNEFDNYMKKFINIQESNLANINYIIENDYNKQLEILENIKLNNTMFPKNLNIIGTFYSDILSSTLYFPYIVSNIIKLICPLILIIFVIFIFMFIKNIFIKNNKEIGILVILGFKRKDINKLIIIYIIKYLTLSIVLSLILLVSISFFLNNYYQKLVGIHIYPFILKFEILYPLIIIITFIFICLIEVLKINKRNYIMEIRND